jgi:hypothetical protein
MIIFEFIIDFFRLGWTAVSVLIGAAIVVAVLLFACSLIMRLMPG